MVTLDHLNRTIDIPNAVKRIVSLVPSQTELLADLELKNEDEDEEEESEEELDVMF